MTRPTWDEYFLNIAEAIAARADCSRRKVGAVVVKNHRIAATGYNGAPAGRPGCLDGHCPRGRHAPVPFDDSVLDFLQLCICGNAWPCSEAVQPLSQYDNCISVHAEANALLYADRDKCEGATIYITAEPCYGCEKLIRGAGIIRVVVKSQEE